MLLYSGHDEENAPQTQGVALMLFKEARNALVGWEPHGSRIIKASFKTTKEGITMNVTECCAPTNGSNDDDKDQFYDRLQSIMMAKHGIQWAAQSQLDDLDFADGLALISYAQQQMQIKITSVSAASASVGLDIHKGKASSLNITQRTPNQSQLMGKLWKMRNDSRI
ncbi:unnamed protein product [Schistosoma mattheei]|uniref:Uncharacterized protein n=1 Tax=Schistosoma mattheei TaxID=31246 RepID=A0A183NLY3_9TREM|nr:unnamed protein product [Schistosoma mattheei]